MIIPMEMAEDTVSLVEQAKDGSRSAFTQLVRLHQAGVRSYLGRFLRDFHLADDLAQEVFLVAFRQLEDYQGSASFQSWLIGIARNRARMYLRGEVRRRRRNQQFFEAALAQWQAGRLEDDSQVEEDQERVLVALRSCIEGLPEGSRTVVDRYYFQKQTTDSIAQMLSKKVGAVRMMLMRIRNALKDCVASKMNRLEAE